MEFTAHELMFIFDAVAHYAARPVFDEVPAAEEFFLAIGEKCEKQLAEKGWKFDRLGTCKVETR